jgi:hypothetical protein
MGYAFILSALLISFPCHAEPAVTFPIAVPQECVELAQREGVPLVIENRYHATKARLKLARLKDSDPMVHECRAAVERAKQAARHNNALAAPQ